MSYKIGPLNRGKYIIAKASGKQTDPNACYFVLRLDTDPHARRAARAYADSVRDENVRLADDLLDWLDEIALRHGGDRPPGGLAGESV